MARQRRTIMPLNTPKILSTPRVNDPIPIPTLQFWNFLPNRSACRSNILRIQHQHQGALQCRRRTRPIFSGMARVKGPIRIVSPFVGVGRAANDGVLVEFDQVLVFQNGQVGGTDAIELDGGSK